METRGNIKCEAKENIKCEAQGNMKCGGPMNYELFITIIVIPPASVERAIVL